MREDNPGYSPTYDQFRANYGGSGRSDPVWRLEYLGLGSVLDAHKHGDLYFDGPELMIKKEERKAPSISAGSAARRFGSFSSTASKSTTPDKPVSRRESRSSAEVRGTGRQEAK